MIPVRQRGRSFLNRSRSAQRAKAVAQLLREQRRLLERREMAAAVELVPVDEVGIDALGPAARRRNDLPGKDAAAHRQLDDAADAPTTSAFSKYMRAEEAAVPVSQ